MHNQQGLIDRKLHVDCCSTKVEAYIVFYDKNGTKTSAMGNVPRTIDKYKFTTWV